MKIFIGCDHAAFDEKNLVIEYLKSKEIEVEDCGPFVNERCDYPDFASKVAINVKEGNGTGILLCGSGIGVSMVANRYKNVRAALCRTPQDAELSREHNDSNILCVGARINTIEEVKKMIDVWLSTDFAGGRHSDRIAKFTNLGV